MNRRSIVLATAATLGGLATRPAFPFASPLAATASSNAAAGYPKPGSTVHYIVPFPPGGLTDVMARAVGQDLAEHWKVNVVIDNRPGGGAQIGADAAAKSAPDGHTLLAVTLAHAANVTLFPKAPFSLVQDLRPVALLASSPMLVVVPSGSPIRSFADLQTAARSRPLNAGSSGNGTPPHLALALFNQLSKTNIQHVPYKGGVPAITDLIGGQLDVVFSNLPESIAQVKAGKLRALAIASAGRHPLVPDVPTTAEAGLPALRVDNWTGLMVPAATPDAVVDKLGREVVHIVGGPDFAARAGAQGFRVDTRGPADFSAYLTTEVERWAALIRSADIRVE